jgi:hypothetical protein
MSIRTAIKKQLNLLLLDKRERQYEKAYKKYVKNDYIVPYTLSNGFHHTGDFVTCPYCNDSKHITYKNVDRLDQVIILEYDIVCKKCKNTLDHFAYGRYEYYFPELQKGDQTECQTEQKSNLQ